ncbi:MAG: PQQ-binding-like beta-propeller repeat protein, partial [Planctomycetes bacterium]|nr:PQQ-binding-like beta-propeller repeat protein [Planctomycetota bacterium]
PPWFPPPEGSFLAAGGGLAYFAPGTGVVHAVEIATGVEKWSHRYTTHESANRRLSWDPTHGWDVSPPIFAEGRLLVAAPDSDELLCLDAATGEEKWKKPRSFELGTKIYTQTVPLGARPGVVYTTGDGVTAWRLGDGEILWVAYPNVIGRGLVTEDCLYVPGYDRRKNIHGIFKIELEGGRVDEFIAAPEGDREATLGNLVMVDGILVSANAKEIVGFDTVDHRESRLRELTRRIEHDPRNADAYFERGKILLDLAESDDGQGEFWSHSLADLEKALELAPAGDEKKTRRYRAELIRHLLELGEKKGDRDLMEKAAGYAATPEDRAAVNLARAGIQTAKGETAEALASYLAVQEEMVGQTLAFPGDLSVDATHLVTTRIAAMFRDAGDPELPPELALAYEKSGLPPLVARWRESPESGPVEARFSAATPPAEVWRLEDENLAGSRLVGTIEGPEGDALLLVQTRSIDGPSDGLQCRRAADGKLIWVSPFFRFARDLGHRSVDAALEMNPDVHLGPPFPVAYSRKEEIIVCVEQTISALHPAGGKLLWRQEVSEPDAVIFTSAPDLPDEAKNFVQARIEAVGWDRVYFPHRLVGDLLVYHDPAGELKAIDLARSREARSPQVAWSVRTGPSRWVELLGDGDRVILVRKILSEGWEAKTEVLVLEAATGGELARFETEGGVHGRRIEVTKDGLVHFLAGNRVVAFDVRTGKSAWTRTAEERTSFVDLVPLGAEKILLATSRGDVRLLDAQTGDLVWTKFLRELGGTNSLLAGIAQGDSVFIVAGTCVSQYPTQYDTSYLANQVYDDVQIAQLPRATGGDEALLDLEVSLRDLTSVDFVLLPDGFLVRAACRSFRSNRAWLVPSPLGHSYERLLRDEPIPEDLGNSPTRCLLAGNQLILQTEKGLVAFESRR